MTFWCLVPGTFVGADRLGLRNQFVYFVLRDVPHLEIIHGPVDRVAISFDRAFVCVQQDLRNGFRVLLCLVVDLLIQLQLHQSVQKIVFLDPTSTL